MLVGRNEVVVRMGEVLFWPGGVVHGAVPNRESQWSGFNVYLDPTAASGAAPLIAALLPEAVQEVLNTADLSDRVCVVLRAVRSGKTIWAGTRPEIEFARMRACRRETYIRRFARVVGLPPAAYSRMERLDHARRLLADGVPPAGAAVASGFADQSHLGRLFRQAYGTTPARYASGR